MCNFPSHLFFSSRFYYSNRTVFVLFEKILKKILTLQYDTFCRNRKTFCNAFRIYSKSQTRNFFATSKKFFDKILHRDVADYQNFVVTEMYLFVTLRNLDVAEM